MRRERKTKEREVDFGCPVGERVEPQELREERSIGTPEAVDGDRAVGRKPDGELLARMLGTENMFLACEGVVRNGGAAGVDGMTVKELEPYLIGHYRELCESIEGGWYKAQPVRRVEIPKADGGVRLLGVPTVIDRMVQQAMVQVPQPVFEPEFSDSGYGFRPGRSARQATGRAKGYYEEGYTWVVDLDLEKFFDTVNHDLLIKMVRETVKDEAIITLIKKFIRSGVMADGLVSQRDPGLKSAGTPQGGPLPPLLGNIYLTRFDRMPEERGHKFVRYAGDCNICVKSSRAAERVMEGCTTFLEGKLKLKVNRKKSSTGSPLKLKFLGFSLYRRKGGIGIRVHEKPLKRLMDRLRGLTGRKRGGTMERILEELTRLLIGWIGYYGIADLKEHLKRISGRLRRRIRQMYWKRWKGIRTRCENLIQLGIPEDQAWPWANTRKGCRHTADSPILKHSLTNQYLKSIGFPDVLERFEVPHGRIGRILKIRALVAIH